MRSVCLYLYMHLEALPLWAIEVTAHQKLEGKAHPTSAAMDFLYALPQHIWIRWGDAIGMRKCCLEAASKLYPYWCGHGSDCKALQVCSTACTDDPVMEFNYGIPVISTLQHPVCRQSRISSHHRDPPSRWSTRSSLVSHMRSL